MTRQELNHALDYINKKIEAAGGPPDYFSYGEIFIADPHKLEELQRQHFLKEMRWILKSKFSDIKFRNEFKERLNQRLWANKDISIIISHFTKKEQKHMKDKGYPLTLATSGKVLNLADPIVLEFFRYLESAIDFKVDNDPVNFYMQYFKSTSLLELLEFFAFDDVKKTELKILESMDLRKTEGLRFGCNDDYINNVECGFKSKVLLPETSLLNQSMAVGQYLDLLTIADFLTGINNFHNIQLGLKEPYIENSIDKEWTRHYFECREKDKDYLAIALASLDGYQKEIIHDKKIITTLG